MKKNNINEDVEEVISGGESEVEEFIDLGVDGEELSKKDIVKKLREKIKVLEGEKQNNLDGWMRAQADYKNREIQIEKDRKEWGGYAVKRFTEDLLVVMDTYDAARSNRQAWESVDANWRGGIEYIFSTFENKLAEQGFEKFGAEGEVFNPEIHEGLGLVVLSEEEMKTKNIKPDTIAQIIMSGYKYKGQIFRAAKVKVYSK
jgi:molecular chaperone GrpE